jgi:ankyrin repeat protein
MTSKEWIESAELYLFMNLLVNHKYDDAEDMLKKHADLIGIKSSIGETALHYLAVENDREAVAWLVSKGADINTVNKWGVPVIFEVAQHEYKELLTWFIQNGANLNAKTPNGCTIYKHLNMFIKPNMIKYLKNSC